MKRKGRVGIKWMKWLLVPLAGLPSMLISIDFGLWMAVGAYILILAASVANDEMEQVSNAGKRRNDSLWTFLVGMAIGAAIFGGDGDDDE